MNFKTSTMLINKKRLFYLQFATVLFLSSCKENESINSKGEITQVGIANISVEEMEDHIPIGKLATITPSNSYTNVQSIDKIDYTVTFGNPDKKKYIKTGDINRPISTQWRYRLLAYRQDGILADEKTFIRGNATSESQTLSLVTGETYTFVCYSQYNTTNINSNDAITSLANPSTNNLNTATLSNGIDGGASFMYWKETIKLTPNLKLKINLKHQFYGYQVTVKAPAGYSFRIFNAGNTSGHGARLLPVENSMTIKMSDLSITNASNTSNLNPNTDPATFLNTINGYGEPYRRLGRLVRFLNPSNANQIYSDVSTTNPPYVNQLTCRETSFLSISDETKGTYPTNKTIFRIAEIQLRRDQTQERLSDTSSVQELIIPQLVIKRYKMNRININLIPPPKLL